MAEETRRGTAAPRAFTQTYLLSAGKGAHPLAGVNAGLVLADELAPHDGGGVQRHLRFRQQQKLLVVRRRQRRPQQRPDRVHQRRRAV